MMRNSPHPPTERILDSVSELDDRQVADICIGVPDGAYGGLRVLERMRSTLREGARSAGRAACLLAEQQRARVLDPKERPATIRVTDLPDRAYVCLDYDLGAPEGESHRPRISRPLRLMVVASRDPD